MPRRSSGFSLSELLIVVAIILIIVAIAISSLMRAGIAANEAEAVSYVRAVNTAETTYFSTYNIGYSQTRLNLGPPPGGGPVTSNRAGLIDGILAAGLKSGYTFNYGVRGAPPFSYTVTSIPAVIGRTGQRAFCSDDAAIILYNVAGADPGTADSCPNDIINWPPLQ